MVRPRAGRMFAAALVAVALVAACTDSKPKRAGKATTTTSDGGAGGGSAADPVPTLEGWARSTSEALNQGEPAATLSALLAPSGDGGWVVAGTGFDGAGVARATVWRSDDALSWKATAVGAAHTEAYGLTRRADGALVVVGRRVDGDVSRAAAWVEESGHFASAGGGDALAGGDQVVMLRVAARPDGLVAVGERSQEGASDAVAVWRSPTGKSWERLAGAEAVFAAAGRPIVEQVVAVPAGLVAVGGVRKGDDIDGAAWFSPDGATWQAAGAAPDFAGPGSQSVEDLVVMDGGLLAVGAANDGRRHLPAAWRSVDGRAWTSTSATFELLGQASDTFGTEVTSVRRAAGALVASGGGPAAHRLWASEDGTTWQEVQLPGIVGGADSFNLDLLAIHGTDIVMASSVDGVPRVLLLRGGRYTEVTATAHGFPAPRPNPCCVELATGGSRLAASADVSRAGRALGTERDDVNVFTSRDGLHWSKAAGSPFSRAVVYDIGVDPSGRLVAAGGLLPARTAGGRHAFSTYVSDEGAWRDDEVVSLPGDEADEGGTRFFTATAIRGERMVMAGTGFVGSGSEGNVDGAIFVKDGAGRLAAVEGVPGLAGPGDEYVDAACAGPGGFVVAGAVRTGAERDAAAWFSPDGAEWRQVSSPAFGGPGDQTIEDCAVTAKGFVAAGSSTTGDLADAAVWTSPDGVTWTRVEAPVLAGDDAQFISGMAAEGVEVVAVGADGRSGEYEVALWHSGDAGATWDRVELGKPFAAERYSVANSVVVAGERVVMGGLVDDRVAIWAGPWPLRRGA